ncbi:MAG TPA: hypothetical protein VKD21_10830 [Acidimicrobiales bacterium]|nr:hypothetical protein [Acidimicrobiales bacterium]
MTPDDRFIQLARFNAAHAKRVWDGSAATEDAPAWYGRMATLIRASAAPATEDELAGESDIVARMEAAMLEPAADDELAGESDIVARMQATILANGHDVDDADRPRHLRPAVPWAARHRQGVRVARRFVAVKAAAITTVVAIGVTAAAATTGIVATVVVPALSNNDPKHHLAARDTPQAAESGSSSEGSGDAGQGDGGGTGDGPRVTMDPDEPLKCMLDLDCLLHEVDVAAGIVPASATPTTEPPTPTPTTTESPTPMTTPTTESPTPMTTPTTEPPPPPTTTTTEPPPPPDPPPPGETAAGPAPAAAPLSASLGESGGSTLPNDARVADLPADAGVGGGAGAQPAG